MIALREPDLKGYATHTFAKKVLEKAFATLSHEDQHRFRHRFMVIAKADGRFVPAICAGSEFSVVNHLLGQNILIFN